MRKTTPALLITALSIIIISLSGCWSFYKEDEQRYNGRTYVRDEAYIPIYGIDSFYSVIKTMPPQPIVESGKIYVLGNTLFQVEQLRGVHVINYSDKSKPVKTAFIKCTDATEIAVKSGFLVVNNGSDLVTVDISDLSNVKEVARVKDAFKTFYNTLWQTQKPGKKGKYYVCPHAFTREQIVVGWKLEKNVENANCYND
jgi:hypothetical protein